MGAEGSNRTAVILLNFCTKLGWRFSNSPTSPSPKPLHASCERPFMRKFIFILLFLFETNFSHSQTTNNCSCEGLVDLNYKKSIPIYNNSFGQIKYNIKQDFKNEDYLTFVIDRDSANFFHLTFTYSMKGTTYSGWVKKANYLGTFSRAYSDTLNLFSKPNLKSKIKSKIKDWTDSLLTITSCKDKWVYVKFKNNIEGWLQDKDQCANPYTTCN